LIGAAPPHQLPPCVNGPFDGITQTLADGTVVGEPDHRDWGCAERGHGVPPTAGRVGAPGVRTAATDPVEPEGIPAPPPRALCLRPAAPNPATVETRLEFALPAGAHVTLAVYARHQDHGPPETSLVRTLEDADLAAGVFTIVWNLQDDHGARL